MAFLADFAIGSVFEIAGLPAPRMRPHLAAAMALNADVALGMAGLARLQISACFNGMFTDSKRISLVVRTQHEVRLDPQLTCRESAVAGIAKCFCIMTAVTLLRVVLGLDRVEADKVAAMALRLVIAPEVFNT